MKFLIFGVALSMCVMAHAEEPIQQCKIAVGAEASQILGESGVEAIRYCTTTSSSLPVVHRLSPVWRDPQGGCHFLEESEPYVKGRTYKPVPTGMAFFAHEKQRFTLYSSFAASCGVQNSQDFFPIFELDSEAVIARIRSMWQELNASDEKFYSFSRKFDAMTGGASGKWRRNSVQIRFLDAIDAEIPWWRRLFGAKKKRYVLGLREGCCNLFTAKLEVDDQVAVIQNIEPSVL